jgi:hypothetical protein
LEQELTFGNRGYQDVQSFQDHQDFRTDALELHSGWPLPAGELLMSREKFDAESGRAGEPASDLWRHTLARIPTLFGRLIYLSSLRSHSDGAYTHRALAQMVGDEQADETLRRSHARVFQDWLCLNLEQQKGDLQEYLAEVPNPSGVLLSWLTSSSYCELAPPAAQEPERQLFVGDLQKLLSVLSREYGAAPDGPTA